MLHVNHCTSLVKWVFWKYFRVIQLDAFIIEEMVSEFVAVDNTKDTSVDSEVLCNIEISPCVWETVSSWNLVSFQEDSLRKARVLDPILNDMNSIVV